MEQGADQLRAVSPSNKHATGDIRLYRVKINRLTWHIDDYWASCRYKSLKSKDLIERTIKVVYLEESVQENQVVLGLRDVHKRISFENLCRDCQTTFIAKLKKFGAKTFLRVEE